MESDQNHCTEQNTVEVVKNEPDCSLVDEEADGDEESNESSDDEVDNLLREQDKVYVEFVKSVFCNGETDDLSITNTEDDDEVK